MVSIRIENLTKRFDDVTAVDDGSLEIQSGELFFLLGPSGCGKTTLLRALAGFHPPDAGTVFFGDRDVTTVPPQTGPLAGETLVTVGEGAGPGVRRNAIPPRPAPPRAVVP